MSPTSTLVLGTRPGAGCQAHEGGRLPEIDITGQRIGAPVAPAGLDPVHRPELRRPRRRVRRAEPGRADLFFKAPNTVVGPTTSAHPARQPRRPTGRSSSPSSSAARRATSTRRRRPRDVHRRLRDQPTTSPSATSSWSAPAASGPRARAARPSTRSGPWLVTADEVRPAGARPALLGQRRAAPGLAHRRHDLRRRTT